MIMDKTYNIACVFRSGEDYNWNCVDNLHRLISKHCTLPFVFHCLTDILPTKKMEEKDIKYHFLKHKWPGWWAKIELFRIFTSIPVFYFDLDTVIVDNIDHMIQYPHKFSALRPLYAEKHPELIRDPLVQYLYHKALASGMMAWSGDCSHIYFQFKKDPEQNQADNKGDQVYIQKMLKLMSIDKLQDLFPQQIISYKLDVQVDVEERRDKKEELPKGTRVVCFSGRPRPWQVCTGDEYTWLDWRT